MYLQLFHKDKPVYSLASLSVEDPARSVLKTASSGVGANRMIGMPASRRTLLHLPVDAQRAARLHRL